MSYRRAWLLVEDMKGCFKEPLVATATGGAKGGGARVTENGLNVLARFLAMEKAANDAVQEEMVQLRDLMIAEPLGK